MAYSYVRIGDVIAMLQYAWLEWPPSLAAWILYSDAICFGGIIWIVFFLSRFGSFWTIVSAEKVHLAFKLIIESTLMALYYLKISHSQLGKSFCQMNEK